MTTYRIPEENMEKLTKKITRLDNKAIKLGTGRITIKEIGEEFVEEGTTVGSKDMEAGGILITMVPAFHRLVVVEIEGTAPKLDNWVFLATLQHTYENGTILRKHTDEELPLEYRTASPKCDHCGTNRRRRDTYIVKNILTGEYKQVGNGCLADFFNGKDPHNIASYAQEVFGMDETVGEFLGFGRPAQYIEIKPYLVYVNEIIKHYGWVSKSKAREIAEAEELRPETTSDIAYDHMFPRFLKNGKINGRELVGPTEESIKIVEEALTWLDSQSADSDYIHNLKTVCSQKCIDHRVMGIAASLIAAYHRDIDKKAKVAKERTQAADSQYIGTIGDRITLKVTVKKVFSFENQWGVKHINKMEDENGNILVWKSGNSLEDNIDKQIEVTGTIKEHEEFGGAKETHLTRCKIK